MKSCCSAQQNRISSAALAGEWGDPALVTPSPCALKQLQECLPSLSLVFPMSLESIGAIVVFSLLFTVIIAKEISLEVMS